MIEILASEPSELNFRQRWATYLTFAVAVGGLLVGFLMRSGVVNATERFENKEVGIVARYPARWLLQESQTNVVFRVQDPAARPFKTTLEIAIQPIGPGTRSALDVLNPLNISRAVTLPAYSTLEIVPLTLPNGQPATQMTYAYTYVESNPALQTVPIVIQAIDVVVLHSSQAIIITFRSDLESFDRTRHYFDDFLRTLDLTL
jgi:hypothetical protein